MLSPVLVVDDHQTFADLMRLGIDSQVDLTCAGVASGVREALELARTVRFDAAVVDLGLPDGDGADLVADLVRLAPHARIIVLTAHPRSDVSRRAIENGAYWVLPKRGRLEDVLVALREDRPGPAPVPDCALSPRERDVVALLAEGLDAQEIAARLHLSIYTVRDHIKAIFPKLGVHTQAGAVVAAAHAGIIVLEPR
ncbi:response regulator transcription factor [Citricoccus sp. NR2]|uniref:response regulator transcription factor n=1 Tax=Citricoccus sp. NR2 TaxID=3004095 RepID=UPI0022DD24BC|nr:response regulator transcription factor [Citricoccus sp. NR2]WBL18276.1 response regulator transcription factor [Citricoccus sp. NR2]